MREARRCPYEPALIPNGSGDKQLPCHGGGLDPETYRSLKVWIWIWIRPLP